MSYQETVTYAPGFVQLHEIIQRLITPILWILMGSLVLWIVFFRKAPLPEPELRDGILGNPLLRTTLEMVLFLGILTLLARLLVKLSGTLPEPGDLVYVTTEGNQFRAQFPQYCVIGMRDDLRWKPVSATQKERAQGSAEQVLQVILPAPGFQPRFGKLYLRVGLTTERYKQLLDYLEGD